MRADDAGLRQIAERYDAIPYTSNAFFYACAGHIRASAYLYGIDTAPLEDARVLELGCASGGNLLPFALAYPRATAVGVDLSPVQITRGREVACDLKAANLTLHAMSLADIGPDFGQFDYIIAHGVYSWVPPQIRQALLRVCRERLAPGGIAYVSYNTYPGWKLGEIVRDAMLLHGTGVQDGSERLARGKAMLDALTQGMADGPLAAAVRAAIEDLRKHSDYYLAHEYLEDHNAPCYFADFVRQAMGAGLAYVGDAEAHTEIPVASETTQQGDAPARPAAKVQRQQYLDFAVMRNFRKSLLAHPGHAAAVQMLPDARRLRGLRAAAHFSPVAPDGKSPPGTRSYRNQRGRILNASEPMLDRLARVFTQAWPASLSWDELCERTRGAEAPAPAEAGEDHAEAVFQALAAFFRQGLLHLSREPGPADAQAADHPRLIPGYAYLAKRNQAPGFGMGCFNLWHDTASRRLPPADAAVLALLDGRRSLDEVRQTMAAVLARTPGEDGAQEGGSLQARAQQRLQALLGLLRAQGVLLPARGSQGGPLSA